MTIIESMQNVLGLIESLGYQGGDLHDDLASSIARLKQHYPEAANQELPQVAERWHGPTN